MLGIFSNQPVGLLTFRLFESLFSHLNMGVGIAIHVTCEADVFTQLRSLISRITDAEVLSHV